MYNSHVIGTDYKTTLYDDYKQIFNMAENRPEWAVRKTSDKGIISPSSAFII
jgi:hypothetical protein